MLVDRGLRGALFTFTPGIALRVRGAWDCVENPAARVEEHESIFPQKLATKYRTARGGKPVLRAELVLTLNLPHGASRGSKRA